MSLRASIGSPRLRPEGSVLLRRLVLVALFIEVGLLLIVIPWSSFWDGNYFVRAVPLLNDIFTNNFVRGGVSGLGVVNLVAGLSELTGVFTTKTRPHPSSTRPGSSDDSESSFAKESNARAEP